MPVAKKPTNRRKPTARQVEHQAIKDLVRDLPSLIMGENDDTRIPIETTSERRHSLPINSNPAQRRWVWIGVIVCTIIISSFWIFNLRTMVKQTFAEQGVERDIANLAGQDLQALLNTVMINNEKFKQMTSSSSTTATSTAPTEEEIRAALLANLATSTN